jgi:4-hydroxy-3-polyprenylbenzoate decarboxylase
MSDGVPVRDLRSFCRFLEERGELVRVSDPVDPRLEVTEIADRFVKAGERPALLFENPRPGPPAQAEDRARPATASDGRPVPLAINLFASRRRLAWALGCATGSLDEAIARIEEPLGMGAGGGDQGKPGAAGTGLSILGGGSSAGFWDRLRLLGKLKEWSGALPRSVGRGPCQEVVVSGDELDRRGLLDLMPVLTTWPGDGGPYVTLPLVITRNPENGRRNIGMYRMQVFDGRTTGMHWQIHKTGAAHYALHEKRGERMPVCVAIGGPPALTYAATAPLPEDIDEALFAGFLTGAPVAFTRAVTCDLDVPAEADFVIEGYVDPGERRLEGPFGDHTGFYSLAEEFPVFHVTAITSRRDPIYLTTIVGPPPMEDGVLGWASERLFLPLMRAALPEIVDVHLPVAACFHNLALVAIRKRYPGHARKVCHALWGMGQMMFSKVIVVVDEDVNVQDPNEALWRIANAVDPRRDTFCVEGPVDQLDHTTSVPLVGGKMGVDATRKWPGEEGYAREWPPVVAMSEDVKALVEAKWGDLLRGAEP